MPDRPLTQRILDMNEAEFDAYVERLREPKLVALREAYASDSIDLAEYERRVERLLAGVLHEPTARDRELASALLNRRRRDLPASGHKEAS